MSRRVMWYLSQVAPAVEVYSIDEAFLDLHGMKPFVVSNLDAFARALRTNVLARTGIPTCVGIAPTKTLAKLANRLAKKTPALGGVCYLDRVERRRWALEQVAVEDVRAIGRQYAQKLYAAGVTTAAGRAGCSVAYACKHLGGVVGARLVRELQGFPCQGLAPSEDDTLSRRSLCCSRTFGRPLMDFPDVTGAVSAFASRVAEKLRQQGDAAHLITVAPDSERRAKLMAELDALNCRFGKGTVKLASLVLPPATYGRHGKGRRSGTRRSTPPGWKTCCWWGRNESGRYCAAFRRRGGDSGAFGPASAL